MVEAGLIIAGTQLLLSCRLGRARWAADTLIETHDCPDDRTQRPLGSHSMSSPALLSVDEGVSPHELLLSKR
jgi:hypothetical protein